MDHGPESLAELRLTAIEVVDWGIQILRSQGMSEADASAVSTSLVRANLRAVDTHGISRLPQYISRLRAGLLDPRAQPTRRQIGPVTHWDAHGAMGHAVASTALASALADAAREPVVVSTITNAGHMGAIGLFALEAAEAGHIALLCQSTPPLMSLPGWSRRSVGNNPIAFAAPVEGRPPLLIDIATSEASRGKVTAAHREGKTIPSSWANDSRGTPTTKPSEALGGWMTPMAAHKGVGLAMMVQVLASALSANRTTPVPSPLGSFSSFLLVINPRLNSSDDVTARYMASWLDEYLRGAPPTGRYPGWASAAIEANRRREGIPFSPIALAALEQLGQTLNIPFPSTCMWIADS